MLSTRRPASRTTAKAGIMRSSSVAPCAICSLNSIVLAARSISESSRNSGSSAPIAATVGSMAFTSRLKIKVDGQVSVLNPSYFAWGAGETHHLEAAPQQTDAQGRLWQFSSWSNGGTATQDIVVPVGALMNGLRLPATYTPFTKLTVNSSLAGLAVNVDGVACTTPCVAQRAPGTQVRVSAPASVPQEIGRA